MPAPRVAVAASGGRDSTALLHCTARAARELGVEVVALHVHHGLQGAADDWLEHVRQQARRWRTSFACERIAGSPEPGASVEAWARRERYRALTRMAYGQRCEVVLLAHHQRDQAETWLLQALRGAGPAGLSAMPREVRKAGLIWARPWLDWPASAIDAYIKQHRLRPIDDPSNIDLRFDRSRLRQEVWPALSAAFGGAEAALAEAASQAQHAASLAAETLDMDLPPLLAGAALDVRRWLLLPLARRRNALQGWLAQALGRGAPHALLHRLMTELKADGSARWSAPSHELRLYRGLLDSRSMVLASRGERSPTVVDLSRPGLVELPGWNGHIEAQLAQKEGADASLLKALIAKPRQGGERFRLSPGAMPRSLKKQFQARGVAAWDREGPLLFTPEGGLVFVPGLGIEGSVCAQPGHEQLRLSWVPGGSAPRGDAGPGG